MAIGTPALFSPLTQAGTTGGFLISGSLYTYQIKAFNATEESPMSNAVGFTPTGGTSTNRISLTWHDSTDPGGGPYSDVFGATYFGIYRTGPGTPQVLASYFIPVGPPLSGTYIDTGANFPPSPIGIEQFDAEPSDVPIPQLQLSAAVDFFATPVYDVVIPQTFNYANIDFISSDPPSPVIPCICPTLIISQGSIKGGTSFTLLDTGISVVGLADDFDGVVLDNSKWTNISSGGGSISVNDAAKFAVPTTGGVSGIRSVTQWGTLDVSSTFSYNNTISQLYPTIDITHFKMSAFIDTTNYFSIEHAWDSTRGEIVRTSVTTTGITTILTTDSVKSPARYLRLVRFGGRILAYAGSNLLNDFRGWRSDLVRIDMSTSCASSPVNLLTTVTDFTPRVLVTFGEEICELATEVVSRIVGVTPSTILPGLVEVIAHGASSSVNLGGTFQYVAPLQLTLAGGIVVSNDDTLRDSTSALKGLRL